jgi:Tol biopolymer transport system component
MRLTCLLALLLSFSVNAQEEWPELNGPYLGQDTPGITPEVFAPGLISLPGERELNSVFSPDGRIFMFTRSIDGVFKMFFSYQQDDGTWQEPRMAPPSNTYPGHGDVDMAFSPDGGWLYFISTRPLPGYSLERYNIWRSQVTQYGLATPEPLGPHINGPGHELYPTLVADGSLYFSAVRDDTLGRRDSYRAQYKDGEFEEPVNLGPGVNGPTDEGDIFVSPDESYLIHVSAEREDALGSSDLYVSFREDDGSWGQDIHMGDVINSEESDYCPVVSPDGKYFFFTRGDDVMWVDAAIIDSYRE